MGDDWQAGDLALCVALAADAVFVIEGRQPLAPGPIIGLCYTVTAVSRAHDCFGRPGVALKFAEIAQRHPRAAGYNAICFRKIRPHTPDAEDAETIRLLNGAPVLEPSS